MGIGNWNEILDIGNSDMLFDYIFFISACYWTIAPRIIAININRAEILRRIVCIIFEEISILSRYVYLYND